MGIKVTESVSVVIRCDHQDCSSAETSISSSVTNCFDFLRNRGWEFGLWGRCYCPEHHKITEGADNVGQ